MLISLHQAFLAGEALAEIARTTGANITVWPEAVVRRRFGADLITALARALALELGQPGAPPVSHASLPTRLQIPFRGSPIAKNRPLGVDFERPYFARPLRPDDRRRAGSRTQAPGHRSGGAIKVSVGLSHLFKPKTLC